MFGLFSKNRKEKIYVAMSGGVDSSVTAALLQQQGYDVTGIYFKTYKPDGNKEYCMKQGKDAKKVCEQLGIPFKAFDLQEEYKKKVFNYMISEYKAGRTPNPDIMCNKNIKFGVFLKKALADGANMIATGHYARISKHRLLKGVDENKDQSYFLSQLSKEQLRHVMFPLGKYKKPKVRKLAERFGLHTASKKDSQGICFIGEEINVKDFLKKHIDEKEGDVLNVKGEKIGTHSGAIFYTIGERHSFKIDPEYQTSNMPRLFIISKDVNKNTITIGTQQELEQRGKATLLVKDLNWINNAPKNNKKYTCRIRHRGKLYKCRTKIVDDSKMNIYLEETPYAPAEGQFAAIYDGDECLGGGVITL